MVGAAVREWYMRNVLWMWHNRRYCDFTLIRAIIPKNSISSWSFVLSIRFENLFSMRPPKRIILVRLQARMSKIRFHETKAFPYCF